MGGVTVAKRLERLVRFVPGVAGYQDRENARATDKQVRMRLVDEIPRLIQGLEERGGIPIEVAASLLLERSPGLRDRHAPDALASWRSNLTQRVLELAAALAAGVPETLTGGQRAV